MLSYTDRYGNSELEKKSRNSSKQKRMQLTQYWQLQKEFADYVNVCEQQIELCKQSYNKNGFIVWLHKKTLACSYQERFMKLRGKPRNTFEALQSRYLTMGRICRFAADHGDTIAMIEDYLPGSNLNDFAPTLEKIKTGTAIKLDGGDFNIKTAIDNTLDKNALINTYIDMNPHIYNINRIAYSRLRSIQYRELHDLKTMLSGLNNESCQKLCVEVCDKILSILVEAMPTYRPEGVSVKIRPLQWGSYAKPTEMTLEKIKKDKREITELRDKVEENLQLKLKPIDFMRDDVNSTGSRANSNASRSPSPLSNNNQQLAFQYPHFDYRANPNNQVAAPPPERPQPNRNGVMGDPFPDIGADEWYDKQEFSDDEEGDYASDNVSEYGSDNDSDLDLFGEEGRDPRMSLDDIFNYSC